MGGARQRSTRQRMAAADKLLARNAQTAAVCENDDSGIIEALQRAASSRDVLLRDAVYLSQNLRSEQIMGFVPDFTATSAGPRGWGQVEVCRVL